MRVSIPILELSAGWHPCPVDLERERYFDGREWTSKTRALGGAAEPTRRPEIGWYPDPADDSRLRYYDGLNWTQRVMPKPGSVAPWARHREIVARRMSHAKVADQ